MKINVPASKKMLLTYYDKLKNYIMVVCKSFFTENIKHFFFLKDITDQPSYMFILELTLKVL